MEEDQRRNYVLLLLIVCSVFFYVVYGDVASYEWRNKKKTFIKDYVFVIK